MSTACPHAQKLLLLHIFRLDICVAALTKVGAFSNRDIFPKEDVGNKDNDKVIRAPGGFGPPKLVEWLQQIPETTF